MSRYICERCKASLHDMDPPHLCPDVAARHKRREAQAEAVRLILGQYRNDLGVVIEDEDLDEASEAIVARLAGMGVGDD